MNADLEDHALRTRDTNDSLGSGEIVGIAIAGTSLLVAILTLWVAWKQREELRKKRWWKRIFGR